MGMLLELLLNKIGVTWTQILDSETDNWYDLGGQSCETEPFTCGIWFCLQIDSPRME